MRPPPSLRGEGFAAAASRPKSYPTVNGLATFYSAKVDSSWKAQGMYFKAGSYVQDNVGSATEGGRGLTAFSISRSN